MSSRTHEIKFSPVAYPFRGVESNGMILSAENSDGELCLIAPTKDFQNGSEIK